MHLSSTPLNPPIKSRVSASCSEPDLTGLTEISFTHVTVNGKLVRPASFTRFFAIENFEISIEEADNLKKQLAERIPGIS